MHSIAQFIVKHRIAIAAVFIVLACVCALSSAQVKVNQDMTQYLPESMQVKQGNDIMTEEFGDASILEVMVRDVEPENRKTLSEDLAKFNLVQSVIYEEDNSHYNSQDYALFKVSVQGNQYSESAQTAYDAIDSALSSRGIEHWIAASLGNTANELMPLYIAAVIIALIILFVLATSWIEPVLVFVTIIIAVLINMGTNVFFPSISGTTSSIAAILQMALSMDYLIMLMNRYRAERETKEPEEAMTFAIERGVVAIASSSVTTVVGLMCLVFMSFTIGADMGVVLAKGVFISLVCVFAVQPALAIATDKLLFSLNKPHFAPKCTATSKFSYGARFFLLVFFLVIFALGFNMKSVTKIDFTTDESNEATPFVHEIFEPAQSVVVLCENAKDDAVNAAVEKVASENAAVRDLKSYENTLGKPYDAQEMADQMSMEAPLVRMLYYYKFHNGEIGALDKAEFANYLRGNAKADLGGVMSEDDLNSLETLATYVDGVGAGDYTPAQLTAAINKRSITENNTKMLYLAYLANEGAAASKTGETGEASDIFPTYKMSIDEITEYLTSTLMNDSTFASFFTPQVRTSLNDAREQIVSAKAQLRSENYSRYTLNVECAPDSAEMSEFLNDLRANVKDEAGESGIYIVGEGPMIQEMQASFSDEFNFISIITIIAIFLIVLITFRNIAIPVLLVAVVQSAFCWDMVLSYALGNSIYYVALIVVQSILMGATIDYSILYTTNYRESRATMGVKTAIQDAYQRSIRTILMSGGILVLVTGILGLFATGLTGKICLIISEGALISVLMVLFIVPGSVAALDKIIVPRKHSAPAMHPSPSS